MILLPVKRTSSINTTFLFSTEKFILVELAERVFSDLLKSSLKKVKSRIPLLISIAGYSLLNISNLKKFKKRLDPRLYNGAIFIGLDTPVVKSHGGTDYIGFSNSLDVCNKIIKNNLIDKINDNIYWWELI